MSSPDQAFIDGDVDRCTVASSYASVAVPATISWLCPADGLCLVFIDGTPTPVDGGHMSDAVSLAVGPVLEVALGLDDFGG